MTSTVAPGGNLRIIITVILTSRGSGRRLQIGTGRLGASCKKKLKTSRDQKKRRLRLLTMEPQARRVESVWEESFHGSGGGSGGGGVKLLSEVLGFTGSRMGTTSSCHGVLVPHLKLQPLGSHARFTPPHVSILPGCVSRVFNGNTFWTSRIPDGVVEEAGRGNADAALILKVTPQLEAKKKNLFLICLPGKIKVR